MTLKTKSKIYKLFGLYLAHKEECEYLKSEEFWFDYDKFVYNPLFDRFYYDDIQTLCLANWQAKNGLTRILNKNEKRHLKYTKWRYLSSVYYWFSNLLLNLKDVLKK